VGKIMAIADYSEPLTQLLALGECSLEGVRGWINYLALRLTEKDIPNLIRMATDSELYDLDAEVTEGWSPIHAWRALGQLRAKAAVLPLLHKMSEEEEFEGWCDWMSTDLPAVFGLVGAPAIPVLAEFLRDRTQVGWARMTAVDGLEAIAKQQPEVAAQCLEVVQEQLTHFAENEPDFNGCLIGVLVEFRVMEAVPLIERAFAARKVDEMFNGDWNEVQVSLGLKSRDEVPRRRFELRPTPLEDVMPSSSTGSSPASSQKQKSKSKAKRKQQSDARRKNCKKK
jgi:hypothetical protein